MIFIFLTYHCLTIRDKRPHLKPAYLIGVLLFTLIPFCSNAQDTFTHEITLDDETVEINFSLFSVRAPNFHILNQEDDGSFTNINPAPIRTYIGTAPNRPGSIAGAIRRSDGSILARLIFEDGREWVDLGTEVTDFDGVPPFPFSFPRLSVRKGGAGSTLYGAQIGIDLPFPQVEISGGTVSQAVEMAEFSTIGLNLPFIRDLSIVHQIDRIIVRSSQTMDPYSSGNFDIVSEWSDLPRGNYDLLMIGSPTVSLSSAIGRINSRSGVALNFSEENGDFGGTARHEVGHIWDIGHNEGGRPEGPTIDSDNELGKFSGPEMEKALRERDLSISELDILPNPTILLPPRASDDVVFFEPIIADREIDVLANDHDVNGDTFSILSFDTVSVNGISVRKSGSKFVYESSGSFSTIADRFSYRIQDINGMTSAAHAHVQMFIPSDNLGYWTFEKSTSKVLDSSSRGNHGTLVGDAFINNNGELVLDGQQDFVRVLPERVKTNSITYSTWIYREGDQFNEAGLLLGNSTDYNEGLMIENNQLAYRWNEASIYFESNLDLVDRTWIFVAVVIEPTQATLYMNDGTGMRSAVNNTAHNEIELREFFNIGAHPDADPDAEIPFLAYFKGRMDDAKIIHRALSPSEISALSNRGLGSRDPVPTHSDTISTSNLTLNWTKSPLATEQRLYFSDDYLEVRNGTPGSASDMGIQTNNTFQVNTSKGGLHFWRVESVEPNGVVKGDIWIYLNQIATSNESERSIVDKISLAQNYPNPFNPNTSIAFTLKDPSYVKLQVYDVLGRVITVLAQNRFSSGTHTVNFDGSGLPTGIYLYKIETNSTSITKKMLLIK